MFEKLMQYTKQHQGRGVHCDLQVQRLASSSAINNLNGRNVRLCQAVEWNDERANSCFRSGKFVLAPLRDPPQEFKQLFGDSLFLVKDKSYNSIFALTSMDESFVENSRIDENWQTLEQTLEKARTSSLFKVQQVRFYPLDQEH